MKPTKTQATARVISDREFVLEHTFKAPAAGAKMAWERLAELLAGA